MSYEPEIETEADAVVRFRFYVVFKATKRAFITLWRLFGVFKHKNSRKPHYLSRQTM